MSTKRGRVGLTLAILQIKTRVIFREFTGKNWCGGGAVLWGGCPPLS